MISTVFYDADVTVAFRDHYDNPKHIHERSCSDSVVPVVVSYCVTTKSCGHVVTVVVHLAKVIVSTYCGHSGMDHCVRIKVSNLNSIDDNVLYLVVIAKP